MHPSSCLLPYPPAPPQIRVYDDEDGARKEEIAQLRLGGADNVFRSGSVGAAGLPAQQALAYLQRGQACFLPQAAFLAATGALPGALLNPLPAVLTPLPPSFLSCSNFYERLKEVREYHRKFPNDDLTEVQRRGGWAVQHTAGSQL